MASIRYAKSSFNVRTFLLKLCGRLQGRDVLILQKNPEACARVLASSNVKGQGIERMIACPAWEPLYSIESVDGPLWEDLAAHFQRIYQSLDFKNSIGPLTTKHVAALPKNTLVDGEQISRLTARILFDLFFSREMTFDENDLYYRASLEWRKEIAVKGRGSLAIKHDFIQQLEKNITHSRFAGELEGQPKRNILSAFAQPFFLSPQINFSDVMAKVFGQLQNDEDLRAMAYEAAKQKDLVLLQNICLEAIRLSHPFPILERELTRTLKVDGRPYSKGTHVYMLLDEWEQDPKFDPRRWANAKNSYRALPFGTGQRMCLGKDLAIDLLGHMLSALLLNFSVSEVKPWKNHLYSGRDNDKGDSLSTLLYQLKVFARVLNVSYQSRPMKRLGCPHTLTTKSVPKDG